MCGSCQKQSIYRTKEVKTGSLGVGPQFNFAAFTGTKRRGILEILRMSRCLQLDQKVSLLVLFVWGGRLFILPHHFLFRTQMKQVSFTQQFKNGTDHKGNLIQYKLENKKIDSGKPYLLEGYSFIYSLLLKKLRNSYSPHNEFSWLS